MTDYKNARKQRSSIFSSVLSKLNSLQDVPHVQCQHSIYVPSLFKNYCVEVELDGVLEAKLVFKRIDLKLIGLCIAGVVLYYSAKRLSKNDIFYYFSGVSIGVLGSILVLLFFAIRFIPKKTTAFFAMLTGSSLFMCMSSYIYSNFATLAEPIQAYLYAYLALSAVVSAIYCYYRGPISDFRLLNIIEWSLKAVALLLIFFGMSYKEIAVAFIIAFILGNSADKLSPKISYLFGKLRLSKYKVFPPTRRLLTQEEYDREGSEYTQKALKDLKEFCRSPQCDTWKIVSRISQPDRLARFIEGVDEHLSDGEVTQYDKYSISTDLIDEDEM